MKPRLPTSILMFISAYSPLFVIFAIRDFDFECRHWFRHPLAVYIMISTVVLSVFLLFWALSLLKVGDMIIKIAGVRNRSVDLFNYSILYVICFFAIDLSKLSDVVSMAFFLLLMLCLTIRTNSIFLNPVLSLFNYNLYDVEYEFDGQTFSTTILTKMKLRTTERYPVISISPFLYLIK